MTYLIILINEKAASLSVLKEMIVKHHYAFKYEVLKMGQYLGLIFNSLNHCEWAESLACKAHCHDCVIIYLTIVPTHY